MRIFIAAWTIVLAAGAGALAQDLKDSRDHPLVPRYEGSEIIRYETQDFTDYRIMSAPARNYGGLAKNIDATLPLEGRLTRITYRASAERSALEVFRNYEKALKEKGSPARASNVAGAISITRWRRERFTAFSASTRPSSSILPPASCAPRAASMSRSMR